MGCDAELQNLQAAQMLRQQTAMALLMATAAKNAADVNYQNALSNDQAAAAIVAQRQAEYDACVHQGAAKAKGKDK